MSDEAASGSKRPLPVDEPAEAPAATEGDAPAPADSGESAAKRAAVADEKDAPTTAPAPTETTEASAPDAAATDGAGSGEAAAPAGMAPPASDAPAAADAPATGDAPAQPGAALIPTPAAPAVQQRIEKKVLVPDEMVGKLIGKQGTTIRTMQQLSNTHIEVQKECAPGMNQRELVITGMSDGVEY